MKPQDHITSSFPSAAKRIFLAVALALLLTKVVVASEPAVTGSEVVLVRDEPMLLNSTVVRTGKVGEKFKVLKYDLPSKRVFVLSAGFDGKPAALNVPEEAVRLAPVDPKAVATNVSQICKVGKYAEARAAVAAAILQDANQTGLKELDSAIQSAAEAQTRLARVKAAIPAAQTKANILVRNANIVRGAEGNAILEQANQYAAKVNKELENATKEMETASARLTASLDVAKENANELPIVPSTPVANVSAPTPAPPMAAPSVLVPEKQESVDRKDGAKVAGPTANNPPSSPAAPIAKYATTPSFPTQEEIERMLTAVGRHLSFRVQQKLDRSAFSSLVAPTSEVYEIVHSGGEVAIVITTSTHFESEGRADMWVQSRGTTKVKMSSGFDRVVPVFLETPPKLVEKLETYDRELVEKGEAEWDAEKLTLLKNTAAHAGEVMPSQLVMPTLHVSEVLRARGFTAAFSFGKHQALLNAIKAQDWIQVITLAWKTPEKPGDVDWTLNRLKTYPELAIPVRVQSPSVKVEDRWMIEKNGTQSSICAISLPLVPEELIRMSGDGHLRTSNFQFRGGSHSRMEVHPDKNGFIDQVNLGNTLVGYYLDVQMPTRGQPDTTKVLEMEIQQFQERIDGLDRKVGIGELTSEIAQKEARIAAIAFLNRVKSALK